MCVSRSSTAVAAAYAAGFSRPSSCGGSMLNGRRTRAGWRLAVRPSAWRRSCSASCPIRYGARYRVAILVGGHHSACSEACVAPGVCPLGARIQRSRPPVRSIPRRIGRYGWGSRSTPWRARSPPRRRRPAARRGRPASRRRRLRRPPRRRRQPGHTSVFVDRDEPIVVGGQPLDVRAHGLRERDDAIDVDALGRRRVCVALDVRHAPRRRI